MDTDTDIDIQIGTRYMYTYTHWVYQVVSIGTHATGWPTNHPLAAAPGLGRCMEGVYATTWTPPYLPVATYNTSTKPLILIQIPYSGRPTTSN